MNFEEHAAKPLLANHGIAVPASRLAKTPDEAAAAASEIGPCVVKAQVPTGKRGKAGGIKLAANADEARTHASNIIGMTIGGWPVEKVMIEAQTPIARELYAAIVNDSASKGPMLLFSPMGGMDVEEAAEADPNAMRHVVIPIAEGLSEAAARQAVSGLDLNAVEDDLVSTLLKLYEAYRALDAELLEINPLVITKDNRVIALDCKLTVDDSAAPRQQEIIGLAAPEKYTTLEAAAAAEGLKYIELGGSVGVLANGAGLTMTTMDAIAHYGGSPANFLEIGGEAYTKAKTALSILLENKNMKSLLVNFCGAFARTDVMAEGVVSAWLELKPDVPIFFTIHGTGEDEAVALVKDRLGIEPFDLMDDAVKAAVAAAAN
ncbi:Malate--CoA ligase subunit beta [Candidatus Filomicrobium marinum]|uniref:Malate--CoA ligase subunit beta n=2 Tax=Filomicrobium TaxID=119044 RepID=A0A0D6JJU5_9HYPH|nr:MULTISPECIES: ATP-grasp domain-containing protein [Filomicrobium]MCV0370891.1 acetate--CoA ligase family protein [Filomicrobium sp.]CFX32785.1 Malate--CoA ligase subunit beta [Candidatus Filomicrobium marinum]CPR21952.1 Malate--CoA ligase subunit beta [Candidatus Filomicrobium marinum]SDP47914.1 succinyl-CoA synthetase beta subunit [Filomicrobium insigne]